MTENQKLREALQVAEAALSDIGDADREPGDDLAWCERRAAQSLPLIRQALALPITAPSPTAGMTLWERIQHVGGRQNAATYIEFGSVMAVQSLINHVLRDLPMSAQEVGLTDADIDAATRHLYHGGKPTSKEYRVGIVRAALRAKGSK